MPTYQYACTACDERLEVVQRFTDDSLTQCPRCGGQLRKVFSRHRERTEDREGRDRLRRVRQYRQRRQVRLVRRCHQVIRSRRRFEREFDQLERLLVRFEGRGEDLVDPRMAVPSSGRA